MSLRDHGLSSARIDRFDARRRCSLSRCFISVLEGPEYSSCEPPSVLAHGRPRSGRRRGRRPPGSAPQMLLMGFDLGAILRRESGRSVRSFVPRDIALRQVTGPFKIPWGGR